MEPQRNHMLAPARHRQSASEARHGSSAPGDHISYGSLVASSSSSPSSTPSALTSNTFTPTLASPTAPPPAYSRSESGSGFPVGASDIPIAELSRPSHNAPERNIVLPSLSAITGGPLPRPDKMMLNQPGGTALPPPAAPWATMNSLSAYHSPGQPPTQPHHPQHNHQQQFANHRMDSPATMDLDASSTSVISAPSPDRQRDGRSSSVNLDDPDVRLAAEALGDLRADFLSSPPNTNAALPMSPPAAHQSATSISRTRSLEPEPLFSLLTTSHPLLATTIEGANAAYGGAKNFSPRFKSSAEYVEGYLTPIANTMGSVGRVTGVEGGVRWFLGAGRRHGTSSSDQEVEGHSKKRRKVDSATNNKRLETSNSPQLSAETGSFSDSFPSTPKGDRRSSMASTVDTLPAYDEMRSPAYTESMDIQRPTGSSSSNSAWQSRLIMSTSGLSVAMSKESLRSLKFCLHWLRWANVHMAQVIEALKNTLEQYERTGHGEIEQIEEGQSSQQLQVVGPSSAEQSRGELAARINSLKNDVLKTLQDVISTVSTYAGGALPENAKILVRRHLTSLPQRFRVATMTPAAAHTNGANSESAIREGANKVLVLAKEGLDMVVQVSGVVDGTIVSAEEWLDRMGKKREPEAEQQQQPALPEPEKDGEDVQMS